MDLIDAGRMVRIGFVKHAGINGWMKVQIINMTTIGVTGHRDLKESCIEFYKQEVSKLLTKIKQEHQNVLVLSAIADGADRVVVHEVIKLDIPYKVILPMDKDLYEMDFDKDSKLEFNNLFGNAIEIITLPLQKDNTKKLISQYNQFRDMQYESAGHYIADNCNTLIALWDKKYNGLTGGTGEIVKYYQTKQNHKLYHLYVSRNKDITNTMVEFEVYENSS